MVTLRLSLRQIKVRSANTETRPSQRRIVTASTFGDPLLVRPFGQTRQAVHFAVVPKESGITHLGPISYKVSYDCDTY